MEPYPAWTFRYLAKCRQNVDDHEEAARKFGLVSPMDVAQVSELWFPPRDRARYRPIADYAKGICTGKDGEGVCPVRVQCLREAFMNAEEHGIFGGLSHRERNALERKVSREGSDLMDYLDDMEK